jgi:hypothetical protein
MSRLLPVFPLNRLQFVPQLTALRLGGLAQKVFDLWLSPCLQLRLELPADLVDRQLGRNGKRIVGNLRRHGHRKAPFAESVTWLGGQVAPNLPAPQGEWKRSWRRAASACQGANARVGSASERGNLFAPYRFLADEDDTAQFLGVAASGITRGQNPLPPHLRTGLCFLRHSTDDEGLGLDCWP